MAYGSDPNQFIDLRLPRSKGPHAALIFIHGGYWRAKYSLEHAGHLCAALTAKGIATFNVEYRRVGNPGGAWPNTFADIRSAYQYVVQNAGKYGTDARIAAMGHSAGGQLALCLAGHEPSLTRVISLAGVVDLLRAYQLHLSNDAVVEFLRGTPAEVPDHYREADPMQLAIPKAQQWLIHGADDDTVPPAFSRDYVKAKAQEDAHLLEIPKAGHFEMIDPRSEAWKGIEGVVNRLLG